MTARDQLLRALLAGRTATRGSAAKRPGPAPLRRATRPGQRAALPAQAMFHLADAPMRAGLREATPLDGGEAGIEPWLRGAMPAPGGPREAMPIPTNGAQILRGAMPAGDAPYTSPTEQEAQTRARILAHGGTDETADATIARNGRMYALMRLQQLQGAGLTDQQGDISAAATAALSSADPAAAWRALSARFMDAFKSAGGQGDPRVWLQQQIAMRRAAASSVAKRRLQEARSRRLDAAMGG